jgi:glycosyltransferase involved in cell wall biosynthesis
MTACLNDFKPDIVHLHAYIQFSPDALKALLEYKKERACAVVLTHHTFAFPCPNDALNNYRTNMRCEKCVGKSGRRILKEACYGSVAGSWGKYIQKRAFQRVFDKGLVDAHICPSEFVRDILLRHDSALSPRVIHNPCLERILTTTPEKTKGKVVYFGRISKEKNIPAAIEAIARSTHDLKLMIIGDGPEAAAVRKLVKECQDRDNKQIVFIQRFMPIDELNDTVKDAEYFILSSICYETAGVSIIEAINLGMTPLVSNWGGMKEMIATTGVGYTFDPGSEKSMRDTIDTAVSHRKRDEETLMNPVRQSLEAFTYEEYMSKVTEIYKALT